MDKKDWSVEMCKQALEKAKTKAGKPSKRKHKIYRAERRLEQARKSHKEELNKIFVATGKPGQVEDFERKGESDVGQGEGQGQADTLED
jgi:hypothetical protein